MMLSGLAQSRPLVNVLAVDIVSTNDSPSFSVSSELMVRSAELARASGVRLHTHLAETADEEEFCLEEHGCTPAEYAESLGWLGPDVWLAHWNGSATQLDNEHRPLILVQATELRDLIVREMTDRKAVASDGSAGKRERLPGVPHVV